MIAITDQERKGMFWFIQGNIKILMICRLLWSLSTSVDYPYFSYYVLAMGGSSKEVGYISSIGILAGMVLYPVGGFLADRSGRVKLIARSNSPMVDLPSPDQTEDLTVLGKATGGLLGEDQLPVHLDLEHAPARGDQYRLRVQRLL